MQTFLPFPSFELSAESLDDKRLGKQRVECIQILHALTDPTYGWQHHPAVNMWRGYEWQLCNYGIAICYEWFYSRLNRDTCEAQIQRIKYGLQNPCYDMPPWFGNRELHRSHRANLLRKNFQFYKCKFSDWEQLDTAMPYVWPTRENVA